MNDPLTPAELTSITMLIEQARSGSDHAREKLLRRLQPFLISIAAKHKYDRISTKQGLSDIVQQSFVRVIENFDSFEGTSGAEFRGWLKQLVINEVRQINRSWKRKRRDVTRENSLDQKRAADGSFISSPESTPEEQAIILEQIMRLKASLSRLNHAQRAVVELRAFENLTFPEIAERLDRSQDAVTKAWYRALIQLQKLISENAQQNDER